MSTAHYGEAGYYHTLLDDITTSMNDGFTVHYENANHQRPDDQPTPTEQTVLADLATMRELATLRMSALGWIHQPTLLHHPAWQRHDLTDLDIIRQIGTETMRRYTSRRIRSLTWPDHEPWRLARHHAMFTAGNRIVIRLPPPDPARTTHADPFTQVLLHNRTHTAVTAATATTDNLVMIWGARHLPGITTALGAAGYRPDHDQQRWHTIGHLPPIAANIARYLLRRPPAPHPRYYQSDNASTRDPKP
ncbi:hypothetical protein [Micromonospora sp. Llam0]|uniref:hypothetical protein n=1 Tax=Micromonospora sp. Llam0 TaxID=2485143 RepID=UPI0011CDEBD8|nr:hypothetical protein [Micromonospora sp. Llam0]